MSWWSDHALDRERWGAVVEPTLRLVLGALDGERFPHGLLLVGPAGLGRELAALETAVLLVGAATDGLWPADGPSDRVRRGVHPDAAIVRPEPPSKRIKIGQIRTVIETVNGRPFEARRRVWIFDHAEAGRFGAAPANAFLKTLEEPPDHAYFILLAGNPAAVLPTIRSRCQRLTLPAATAIADRLDSAVEPLLAAWALAGIAVEGIAARADRALRDALDGEVRGLLGLAAEAAAEVPLLEIVAAVAIGLARDRTDGDRAGDLVRLAAALVDAQRRVASLNLDAGRQLTACLLDWHRQRID